MGDYSKYKRIAGRTPKGQPFRKVIHAERRLKEGAVPSGVKVTNGVVHYVYPPSMYYIEALHATKGKRIYSMDQIVRAYQRAGLVIPEGLFQ